MTTIFNTREIVDPPHGEYQRPDIEAELTQIFQRTDNELSYLEFSTDEDDEADFKRRHSSVQSELSELKDFAKGSTLSNFIDYVTNLESLVVDLTDSLIRVSKKADDLSLEVLDISTSMSLEQISDEFMEIKSEAESVLNCDLSLNWALTMRGWNNFQRDFIYNIMGNDGDITVGLLAHGSTANQMVVGIDEWISLVGKTFCFCNGSDTLQINAVYGNIEILLVQNNKPSRFKVADMKDIFMDVLNPTDEEIKMYEMISNETYDIFAWKEIFGTRKK